MLAAVVDAAVGGDPPQPERHVIGGLEAAEMVMQLQEHVLREVFGRRPVLQGVIRDAEHHRLMTCDEDVEVQRVERVDRGGVESAGVGGECCPHPSWDIYEKDGAVGCRTGGTTFLRPGRSCPAPGRRSTTGTARRALR